MYKQYNLEILNNNLVSESAALYSSQIYAINHMY